MIKQMISVFMMAIFIMSMPTIVHADFADEIKLIADDSANGDDFGESVSISGNTAIVGARSNDSNGSAYIFVRDPVNNMWTQQQKLRAADGAFQDNFGVSVSISGDTAIIGAGMDDDAGTSTGSAYVFVRNPSTGVWALQQKLLASDGAAYDYFGRSVAISGDRVIVGSPWPTGITSSTGYAYIFVRDPATGAWTEQEKLAPSDGVVNDYFGSMVAIDGGTALVGAGVLGATTYTYEYNSVTGNWDESNLILANTSVYVGNYVSIRGDIAITGAPYITSYGSAYIFERNPTTGEWTERQRLLQPSAVAHYNFGSAVSIGTDIAIVGAYRNGEPALYAGAAYAFVRDPSTGVWTPQELLASDGGAFYQFGYSVSIDGDTIIVGANGANGVEASTGAAYIYTYTATVLPASDITVTDSVVPATDLVVAFGDVTELASADQTVTITNDGNADLTLGNIPDADALAAPFTIETDTCSSQVLTPAANCMLTVRFSPTSTGTFSDSFDIPSDDPDENPVTIYISGIGIGLTVPDISVTDSIAPVDDLATDFGNVTEATTSDQTITISNLGNADLVMGDLAMLDTLASPFSIFADNCSSQTVVAAASCTVTVRFAPVTAGAFSDSFDIPSNDSDEASVTFNLGGTGTSIPVADITVTDQIAPANDLQIPFTDLTVAGSSDQTVTITNDGNADLVIGNVAQANVLATPFSVINDNCSGQTLAAAASCTLVVRFAPTAAGIFNDSFDIPSNDPDESSVTVNVSATGVAAGVNNPPSSPGLVAPVNGRQGLGSSVLLEWNPATDPDGDAVRYDVYNCTDSDPLNNCSPLTEVASLNQQQDAGVSYASLGLGSGFILLGITFAGGLRNRRQTVLLLAAIVVSSLLASCGGGDEGYKTYRVSGLNADTTYYWAIVAKDGNGGETPSAVWRYSTQ